MVGASDPAAGIVTAGASPAIWSGGRYIALLEPRPEDFDLETIAAGLARENRWGAAATRFHSVAAHSITCAEEAFRRGRGVSFAAACLLHDAAEAYLGDVSRPLKSLLPEYREVEARFARAIAERFGLEGLLGDPLIREIDNAVLSAEKAAIVPDAPPWPGLPPADPAILVPSSDPTADEVAFLDMAESLSLA